MTLREQLARLQFLLEADIYSDAPECAEQVGEVRLLAGSLAQAAELCTPDFRPLDREGLMTCPGCGIIASPSLVEDGYTVTHEYHGLDAEKGVIRAAAFNGLSEISEIGSEDYFLACHRCGHRVSVPADLVIEWEEL
jgi:hypothetical protein